MNKISVTDFENKIFEKEGVRVIIRHNGEVNDYDYKRKLPNTDNLSSLKGRIDKALGENRPEYSIILGDGNANPHGLTGLEKARNSYK